jgi:DNA-binding response OmpR family regulator
MMLTGNRPRVLVVDNMADTADSLALLLRLWGYAAEACYEGSTVLETARTYQPHVVLLDIGMPRMDGFQVAQRLRRLAGARHTVLIAITGYGDKVYRIRAHKMGFYRYLLKPVDPCELHELLIRVVGHLGFPQAPEADEEALLHGDLRLAGVLGAEIPALTELSVAETFSLE